tara:strand:+ start:1009 stop:1476 length:468 start_codon:yes stop_codon:yes gene_type:complete
MDISNEATIIKNKQILDKFSINIHLIKKFIYSMTFIGLFITLYVTFFPVKSSFNTQKMRRLKYMLFDKHWIIMFFMIICINILVNVVKVDTMNDSEQLELIRLQQAVLIGSVLFVTSFLSNLGYTVSLFFIGFAVWYFFKINILSPAPSARTGKR